MKQEMVCISCPMGCNMDVEIIVSGITSYNVSGNKCPRGEEYAIKEMTNPTRVITSTVKLKNGHLPRLPVKTSEPIPKGNIFDCIKVLDTVEVTSPVKVGDVIIENLLGLDINIIASRSI